MHGLRCRYAYLWVECKHDASWWLYNVIAQNTIGFWVVPLISALLFTTGLSVYSVTPCIHVHHVKFLVPLRTLHLLASIPLKGQ